jgi:hypothetical protein
MSQKNIYIKKIISCLIVLCISAYNMQPEDKKLQRCHALSLARITQKNSWESNFPIQYTGSTQCVEFNPNKQKQIIAIF